MTTPFVFAGLPQCQILESEGDVRLFLEGSVCRWFHLPAFVPKALRRHVEYMNRPDLAALKIMVGLLKAPGVLAFLVNRIPTDGCGDWDRATS